MLSGVADISPARHGHYTLSLSKDSPVLFGLGQNQKVSVPLAP